MDEPELTEPNDPEHRPVRHPSTASVSAAEGALLKSIAHRGCTTALIQQSPTFCRLSLHGYDQVLVDLAIDSPSNSPPRMTLLGPTMAPLEFAGRKLLALFGRAEARDWHTGSEILRQADHARTDGSARTQVDDTSITRWVGTNGRIAIYTSVRPISPVIRPSVHRSVGDVTLL